MKVNFLKFGFIFILVGLFMVVTLPYVSSDFSFSLEPIKIYDSVNKEVILIENSILGEGNNIAKIKLETDLVNYVMRGKNRLVAEMTIESYEDYPNALKEMNFYNVEEDMKKFYRPFHYKYKIIESYDYPIYNLSCIGTKTFYKNGTEIINCSSVFSYNKIKERIVWNNLNSTDLIKGNITIGIFTDVFAGDRVEWIPNFYNVDIPEFAVWVDSMEIGLIAYYNFSESSGDLIDLYRGKHNGTIVGDGVTRSVEGKIGNGYEFSGSSDYVSVSDHVDFENTGTFAYSVWLNLTDSDENRGIISYKDGDYDTFQWIERGANDDYYWRLEESDESQVGNADFGDTEDDEDIWVHHVWIGNGSDIVYYRDGVEDYKVSYDGTRHTTTGDFWIGGNHESANSIIGIMDELYIWNRSLTITEILVLNDSAVYSPSSDNLPTIIQNNPVDYFNSSSSSITFNWSIEDDYMVDNSTLFIDDVFNQTISHGLSNFTSEEIVLNVVDGLHNWTVFAYDNESQISINYTRFFTIDTISPNISIVFPENNIFSSNVNLNINFTSDDSDSCWFSNDTMSLNTTLASCVNITAATWFEGQHNITIWANDTFGNENSSLVSFIIDTINPQIEITYPVNYQNITGSDVDILYTSSDVNLDSCWFSNDSMSVNTTLSGCGSITDIVWSNGIHNLTIWVNDSVNNINSSIIFFNFTLSEEISSNALGYDPDLVIEDDKDSQLDKFFKKYWYILLLAVICWGFITGNKYKAKK